MKDANEARRKRFEFEFRERNGGPLKMIGFFGNTVVCRHGGASSFTLTLAEWLALPLPKSEWDKPKGGPA